MNFEQAKQLSFLVPWKAIECFSGPDCWCRIIVPVEPILYSHPENPDNKHEYVIVDTGALDQESAEYIVRLHNEHHERVKQSCRDAMKETMDSLISLEEITEQFEKLWENKQSKIGKIVRKEID
jgi:hypothetical protein